MMIKDPNESQCLTINTKCFKRKLEALLFFYFLSCAEEKFAGEEFGTIEGKVVSAVDFKPWPMLKCSQTQY
jgi:hypothetical protein